MFRPGRNLISIVSERGGIARALPYPPYCVSCRRMESPPNPVEFTSFLESLKLGELWSENGLTAWGMLLLAIFVGLMAGRLTTWALGRHRPTLRGPRLGRPRPDRPRPGRPGQPGHAHPGTERRAGRPADGRPSSKPSSGRPAAALDHRRLLVCLQPGRRYRRAVRRLRRGADAALDRQIVLLVSRSLRVFLVVVGTLFVAESVFDQDIGAWLAGLGIAGLAVSLAAQDSLKHLFGSVTILLDRSFRIGDCIVSGSHEGTIEDIGFRSTQIRTPAGHVVTIPNSNLVNNPIENLSRRPAIRRVVTLPIAGRTPSEKLREALGDRRHF